MLSSPLARLGALQQPQQLSVANDGNSAPPPPTSNPLQTQLSNIFNTVNQRIDNAQSNINNAQANAIIDQTQNRIGTVFSNILSRLF